jgi:hypothetical protein
VENEHCGAEGDIERHQSHEACAKSNTEVGTSEQIVDAENTNDHGASHERGCTEEAKGTIRPDWSLCHVKSPTRPPPRRRGRSWHVDRSLGVERPICCR